MGGVMSVVAVSCLGADGVDGADHGLYMAMMRRSDDVAGQLRSTACGTRLGATASSGGWIATSLVSVRLIVSSILWVACGTETEAAMITARSPGARAAEYRQN